MMPMETSRFATPLMMTAEGLEGPEGDRVEMVDAMREMEELRDLAGMGQIQMVVAVMLPAQLQAEQEDQEELPADHRALRMEQQAPIPSKWVPEAEAQEEAEEVEMPELPVEAVVPEEVM